MALTPHGLKALRDVPSRGFQPLYDEEQGVACDGHPTDTVAVFSSFSGEPEASINKLRPLRAVMKQRLGPASRSDVLLEPTSHHLDYQFEKANEVRLSCPILTD